MMSPALFSVFAACGGVVVGAAGMGLFVCAMAVADEWRVSDLLAGWWATVSGTHRMAFVPNELALTGDCYQEMGQGHTGPTLAPFVPGAWPEATTVLPQVRARSPHLQSVIDHEYERARTVPV